MPNDTEDDTGNSGASPAAGGNTEQSWRRGSATVPAARVLSALGLDLITVTAFVVLGRRTHQESSAIAAVATTLAPFLMGLILSWVVGRVWERPRLLQTGVIVWVVTLTAGMFTRRVLFGEGIATTFIVVTAAFLATGFIGWRLIASRLARV